MDRRNFLRLGLVVATGLPANAFLDPRPVRVNATVVDRLEQLARLFRHLEPCEMKIYTPEGRTWRVGWVTPSLQDSSLVFRHPKIKCTEPNIISGVIVTDKMGIQLGKSPFSSYMNFVPGDSLLLSYSYCVHQ